MYLLELPGLVNESIRRKLVACLSFMTDGRTKKQFGGVTLGSEIFTFL